MDQLVEETMTATVLTVIIWWLGSPQVGQHVYPDMDSCLASAMRVIESPGVVALDCSYIEVDAGSYRLAFGISI